MNKPSKAEKLSVAFSKSLTKLLRHDAIDKGIQIQPDGYMQLSAVLEVNYIKKFNATLEDVQKAVEDNAKKRFELNNNNGIWMIRAVQGHTMAEVKDDELLTQIGPNKDDKNSVYDYP